MPLDPRVTITGSVIVGRNVPERSAGCAVAAVRDALLSGPVT